MVNNVTNHSRLITRRDEGTISVYDVILTLHESLPEAAAHSIDLMMPPGADLP